MRGAGLVALLLVVAGPAACRGSQDDGPDRSRPRLADPPAAADRSPDAQELGAPRDDLERFVGVYGDPDAQDRAPRNVFVDQTCDGRLRFGAMWGDVAPWVMKRLSDTEFEQALLQPYETEPIRLEFQLDEKGQAEGVTHTLGERSRIRRLGDLPDEFDDRECPG